MTPSTIETSKGTLADFNGPPARPEAEKPRDTPGTPGEASHTALGNSRDDAASIPSAEVPLVASITRATMRLRIEPWRPLSSDERELHAKRQCAGKPGCVACALSSALYDTQRECAAIANLIARGCERMDGAFWDEALVRANGAKVVPLLGKKTITGKDGKTREVVAWPSDDWNAYEAAWQAFPGVLRGIVSALAHQVTAKWRKERFDVLAKQERSAARYKRETMPIPLRAADCRLIETDIRDAFTLRCSLRSGRVARGKEWEIPIKAKDQRQYRVLHEIASGAARMGEIEIKRDRQGKHWELRIAYKRRVELVAGEKLAAVNRGIACVLAVVTEDGEQLVYDGYDIEAYLRQMQARRKEFQRTWRVSGRRGRGTRHALGPTDILEGKATRWRQTRMQTIAREVAKWLRDRAIAKVLLDDLKGIRDGSVDALEGGKTVWDRIQTWPYFEQGARLESCLIEEGIQVEKRPVPFASRDCPECGHRHEERQVKRMFECVKCGFRRHVDVVFGLNLIKRERLGAANATTAKTADDSEAQTPSNRTARKRGRNHGRSRRNGAGGSNG